MVILENQCVDCGLPCLGSSCPHLNVPVTYCDKCKTSYANYHLVTENIDLCRCCAEKYMQEAFDDLTVIEKAKMLNIPATSLGY